MLARLKLKKEYLRDVTNHLSPAMLTVLICGLIGFYLLIIAPIHGYADNGDFARVLNSNGLYSLNGNADSKYVITQYGIKQFYNETASSIWKTQNGFIQLAILLNRICFSSKIFDIRFLGFVYLLVYGIAVYLFTRALTPGKRTIEKYVVGLLVGIVAGDSAFMMYFNSFYPQATTIIFMVLAVALLIYIPQLTGIKLVVTTVGYFVAVILLVLSDYSNAPLSIVFAIATISLFFLPRVRYQRWYLGAGVVMILLAGGLSTKMISPEEQAVNTYQAFTKGVLLETPNPNVALKNTKINEQFTLMKEQDYFPTDYTALKPNSKYVKHELIDKYNIFWLTAYYGRNLKQLDILINDIAKNIMVVQVSSLGNYTKGHGRALQQFSLFTIYSQLTSTFYPKKYAFNAMIGITLGIIYAVGMYNDFKNKKDITGIMKFFLMLGLMLGTLILPLTTLLIFGQTNLAQHMLPVSYSLNLVYLTLIADTLQKRLWKGTSQ